MLRILESQAPAKQTATDTINTLSSRLSSATLLEDRRAAILGLRSFAKQFPASVASGALRDLIAGLRRDGEDPDTLKVVLETLLMLFEPDEKSPEASEDIPLWLSDEFTQRQDNVTALLDLLETGEFYLRLYSLQILSQVCAARPQRAQEAIITAPLGVSRITAVLEDKREAVRNEALLLLVALTPTSAELQKVVAFEDAFNRVFAMIDAEGGLTHGSTTVQDCLSLLSNLLKLNPSNQAYFREMGCIGRVAKILAQVIKEEESPDGVSEWVRPQRDVNLWGLLTVLQLFLVRGSQGTPLSQDAFWRSGLLQRVLQIAFHQTFAPNVRARALETCADIIRSNSSLQEQFGDLAVPAVRQSQPLANGRATPKTSSVKSGSSTPANVEMSNVIESLLDLTLDSTSSPYFDIRLAACNCVKAFFDGHNGIRGHVLRRAIEGHKSGDDAVPNILTVLLEPPSTRANSDSYQQWMAAVLLMHLLIDNSENKEQALKVSENDNEGEEDEEYEVVTFVQSITSNIVAGVQHPEDERALIGYLMMLSVWLFEDLGAVNDLLGETSSINGLISAVKVASPTMPLVAGLCTFLLGIVYEFSTKDSPIPRAKLHDVIMKGLTREVYLDKLTKLRESPYIRDFEVMPTMSDGGLPDVYFDQTFVEFFKDNFSRFLRAIDREPGFEVSIMANGVQKGVSRELVDSLRAQIDEQRTTLEKAESELVSLRQRLEQEELEHRRTRDSTTVELGRIKQINQSLHTNHEAELQAIQQDFARQKSALVSTHEAALAQMRKDQTLAVEQSMRQHKAELDYVEQRRKATERDLTRTKDNLAKRQAEAENAANQARRIQDEQQNEINALHKNLKVFEEQMSKAWKEHESQLQALRTELQGKAGTAQIRVAELEEELTIANAEQETLQKELSSLNNRFADAEKRANAAEASIEKTSKELQSSQGECEKLQKQLEDMQKELNTTKNDLKKSAEMKSKGADISAEELEMLRAAAAKQKDTQTELDDLLVVFADLEAKRVADKQRLKELGEEVSEDEDEGADDGDEDEEDEEDEDEDAE
ncbi:Vesicle-mediated ER to Golgi transport protein [Neophaeococcomyces mojaviensis]|uniref:Vesicle-mediated ER to Golgi transport protein n=1 Tax=Neophaeococcomyces mojaviensis TaxID=3383035 RepID=A0ACC3ACB4_9EURO|nr:Vesicle-mediated ER to Golgi transport protein [Knufia sp. JES_112]